MSLELKTELKKQMIEDIDTLLKSTEHMGSAEPKRPEMPDTEKVRLCTLAFRPLIDMWNKVNARVVPCYGDRVSDKYMVPFSRMAVETMPTRSLTFWNYVSKFNAVFTTSWSDTAHEPAFFVGAANRAAMQVNFERISHIMSRFFAACLGESEEWANKLMNSDASPVDVMPTYRTLRPPPPPAFPSADDTVVDKQLALYVPRSSVWFLKYKGNSVPPFTNMSAFLWDNRDVLPGLKNTLFRRAAVHGHYLCNVIKKLRPNLKSSRRTSIEVFEWDVEAERAFDSLHHVFFVGIHAATGLHFSRREKSKPLHTPRGKNKKPQKTIVNAENPWKWLHGATGKTYTARHCSEFLRANRQLFAPEDLVPRTSGQFQTCTAYQQLWRLHYNREYKLRAKPWKTWCVDPAALTKAEKPVEIKSLSQLSEVLKLT